MLRKGHHAFIVTCALLELVSSHNQLLTLLTRNKMPSGGSRESVVDTEQRRFLRVIIRQVHPDLFASNPYERQCNSDSLQVSTVCVL